MDSAAALRQCLEEMDVEGARSLWKLIAPNMPQPKTEFEATVTLHMARTQMKVLSPRQRYYSHCWLLDHGQMSQLPDEERPMAERMFPRVVTGVGISVNFGSLLLRPAMTQIRSAMEYAVHEAYADGKSEDIPFIRKRMSEARRTVTRKLFGI